MKREKQVEDREEMEQLLDEFVTRGYKIESQDESVVVIKKEDWGDIEIHFLTAILTVWWTLGFANVLYAVYKQITAEEIVIHIGDKIENDYTKNGPEEISKEDNLTINRMSLTYIFSQIFSVFVSIFVIITILTVHSGYNRLDNIPLAVFMLAVAVLLRYITIYHQFTKTHYKKLLFIPTGVAFIILVVYNIEQFLYEVSLRNIFQVFYFNFSVTYPSSLLPNWLPNAIIFSAGLLIIIGSLTQEKLIPYPRPGRIRSIAVSPVFFGAVCAFFGLWAVLFVGFSIQRVFIIAPVFEELLKFGVALLIGSSLFDRSILARLGVAVIVGALFGIIEHSTTYPYESDHIYLFRILFHLMTTVLSVSLYSYFESLNMSKLKSRAPVLSIIIHFFYNTFAVFSSIITTVVVGAQINAPTLVYGSMAVLITTSLVALTLSHHRIIRHLHMPLDDLLTYLF